MAVRRTKVACVFVGASARLAEVSTKLASGEYDFDTAQAEVTKIQQEFEQDPNKVGTFEELMIKNNLNNYGIKYLKNESAPQLVLKILDADNKDELFRYKDTAKNRIDSKFSRDVFSHLFVNRSRSFNGNPYVTTKNQFNSGISQFKNDLCKIITESLKIEGIDPIIFKDEKVNFSTYDQLMNHEKVQKFMSDSFQRSLDDPIKYDQDLTVSYALYALNNFDTLLEEELNGLITINPENKGKLSNSDYVENIENTSTTYWADDSHDAKNIQKYTSNLAKFIVKQIPRVIKRVSGNNVFYEIKEGQYMGPNELYILSHVLKQAEFEYNLKYPNDTSVSLATNLVDSIKVLFDHRSDLPAFKEVKRDIIDSFESFLYNGDSNNYSISELYKNNFERNPDILDIEGLLGFEVYQSFDPSYLDFDSNYFGENKNYGGKYQSGSQLKWNLAEYIFTEAQSKRKKLAKNLADFNTVKFDKEGKILKTLNNQIFHLENETLDNLLQKKENKIYLQHFAALVAKYIHNKDKRLNPVLDELKKDNLPGAYQQAVIIASSILDITKKDVGKEHSVTFPRDYSQSVSDIPQIQFTANDGSTMPVYRLNSAITHLPWFIKQYKQDISKRITVNPETGETKQNFLVDNPKILSRYISSIGIESEDNYNARFRSYVAYVLGIGDEFNYNKYNELPSYDLLHIQFLTNLQGWNDSTFYMQPVCNSDKSSIPFLAVNTLTKFQSGFNKIKSLKEIMVSDDAVEQLREIDYKYRKNSQLQKLNSLLIKWNDIKNLVLQQQGNSESLQQVKRIFSNPNYNIQPFLENELGYNRIDMSSSLYSKMNQRLFDLNNILNESSRHLYSLISLASANNIELIDELDYSKVKGKVGINQSLLLDFYELQNLKTFEKAQDIQFEKLLNSEEFKQMIDSMSQIISKVKTDSHYYKLLCKDEEDQGFKFFSRKWNSEKKGYDVTPKMDNIKEEYAKQTALANLLRYAYIDLVPKSYYLDPAKKLFDDPNIERAKRIDAMSKRMVLNVATIQAFAQGKIDGISQEVKVAVIEDAKEMTWNLNGDIHDQDIYDGSGWLSPFESYMEDNSIPGHGIEGTKKTLGTSTRGNNGTLFKWAAYPITNEKMRNSKSNKYSLYNLFKKMHSQNFGNVDITKGFNNKMLSFPATLIGKGLYESDGFTFYQILEIKPYENNRYIVKKRQSKYNGDPVQYKSDNGVIENIKEELVEINSIFDLWEALGGTRSLELQNRELVNSEGSIEATFQYIINVGEKIKQNIRYPNQSNIKQPLRNAFIGIAVNKSAVKRGAANLNTTHNVWETNVPLNTFTINTSCFGVQLDANHHADLGEIREMTQTISTLATLGYTANLAEEAYNTIGLLVEKSLSKINQYLTLQQQKGIKEAIGAISRKLVIDLSKEDNFDSLESFTEIFIDDLNTTVLPLSDRHFYRTFVKSILEDLNKSSIRRQYTGMAGILNPASNIMQVFEINGKQYLYTSLLRTARKALSKSLSAQQTLQNKWREIGEHDKEQDIINYYLASQNGNILENSRIYSIIDPKDINQIKVLDTVEYRTDSNANWVRVTLDTNEKYLDFWRMINQNTDFNGNNTVEIRKDVSTPHDLRPQNISWNSVQENSDGLIESIPKNIYTTKEAQLSSVVGKEISKEIDINKAISDLAELGNEIKNSCKI